MALVLTRSAHREGSARASSAGRGAAVLVAVVVFSAAVAVDPYGARPFTTLRWPLVAAGVLGAGALLWTRRPPIPRPVGVLGLALLAWILLATVAGADGLIAWVGHPRRHFGLLAWLVCAVALVVGASLDERARRLLGAASCAASALLGAGALLELCGVDVAGASYPGPRAGGFLGQPAYLGALGVLLVPVAVAVASTATSRAGRWSAWTSVGLGIAAVVTSQTRGAWIALAVASLLGWTRLRGRASGAVLALAAAVFALAVLVAALPMGPRLLAAFDDGHSPLGGRVDEWRVAAQVVADHPVLGAGPEGYRLVVPDHLDLEYSQRYGRDVIVDRAHDGVLDVAVSGGLPAGVLYVALLAAVAVLLWRARRDATPLTAGAAIGALAYGVQQVVLFPLAEVDPLAWLLVGVALVPLVSVGLGSAPSVGRMSRRGIGQVAVAVLLGAMALGTVVAGVRDVASDREMATAQDALGDGDQRTALIAADRATVLRPDSIDAWYLAARVAAAGGSLIDIDVALDRVGSGLARSPKDPALLDLQEELLVERALRSGSSIDADLARAAVEERMANDPGNPRHPSLMADLDRAATGEGSPRP
jgi:putative inorganic carbon (HCO3(-)) transporter